MLLVVTHVSMTFAAKIWVISPTYNNHIYFSRCFFQPPFFPGNQTHFFPGNPPKNHPRSSQPGDESQVESVIMRHEDRTTICVSSQATGCARATVMMVMGPVMTHQWHVEKTYEKTLGSPLGTVSSCCMHTFFLCQVDFCEKCHSKAVSIVATSPSWSTGSAVLYAISYNHRHVNIAHACVHAYKVKYCNNMWYKMIS